jgi:hypothetical protein
MIDHSREQLRDFEHIVRRPSIALKEKYVSGSDWIIFGQPGHAAPRLPAARADSASYWQMYDFYRSTSQIQAQYRICAASRPLLRRGAIIVVPNAPTRRLTRGAITHIMCTFTRFLFQLNICARAGMAL